jgi:hypothetical protein
MLLMRNDLADRSALESIFAICGECIPGREDCRYRDDARTSLEGLGAYLFGTVRKQGYDIDVLKGYDQKMSRSGVLLAE